MAAENPHSAAEAVRRVPRFNEAAANGRGKHGLHRVIGAGESASMRPRRMAAENPLPVVDHPRREVASMRPRRMAAENQLR